MRYSPNCSNCSNNGLFLGRSQSLQTCACIHEDSVNLLRLLHLLPDGIETRPIACYTCRYTALQLLHFVGSVPQRLPPHTCFGDLAGIQQQIE
jgi:hypothetical protein